MDQINKISKEKAIFYEEQISSRIKELNKLCGFYVAQNLESKFLETSKLLELNLRVYKNLFGVDYKI